MEKPKRKPRKRPESIFLSDFGRSWKEAGGYWYKIPDTGGQLARFAPPRPYDANAAMAGKIFVIEAKYCKTVLFSLSEMRPHQIPELWSARQAGYEAFVIVCYHRLQAKVADFYRVETLMKAEKDGRTTLSPEEAHLRVYSPRRAIWEISPRSILLMLAQNPEKSLFAKINDTTP
jgi:hypothetical protein